MNFHRLIEKTSNDLFHERTRSDPFHEGTSSNHFPKDNEITLGMLHDLQTPIEHKEETKEDFGE